jgi:transcriptional regulator with XRE-family HTH domain
MKYDKNIYASKKDQARTLRSQGFTTREIAKKLSISRSTSSVWTRGVALNKNEPKKSLKDLILSNYPSGLFNDVDTRNKVDDFKKIDTLIKACEQQNVNSPKVFFEKGYAMARVNEPFRTLCALFMRLGVGDPTNYRLEWLQNVDDSDKTITDIKFINSLFKYIPQNLGWSLNFHCKNRTPLCDNLVLKLCEKHDPYAGACQGITPSGNKVIAYANASTTGVQYLFNDPEMVFNFIQGGITYVKKALY